MNHRLFPATVAVLAFIAFAGLASGFPPSLPLSSQAYAQTQASTAPAPSESVAKANSAPQFPSSETGVRSVDENTPSYQNIGAPVTATDPNNDTLTYSLENAGASHFGIVRSTGQLQTGTPLDYETRSSYTVKVVATDPSGVTDRITVTIKLANLDEPGTVSLYWTQPQVDTALEATLADPDGGVSGTTWSWDRSSDRSSWSAIDGASLATYTPVNEDVRKYLRATATYTDGEGGGKTISGTSKRPVRAAPPSENRPPTFGKYTDTDLSVKRIAPPGTKLYNAVYAEDPDGDEVRYSLEGTDAASFDIDASSGHVITKASMRDVEKTEYTVTVKARDPSGNSETIDVTITVTGSKESPAIVGPKEISYPENGTWQVATYTATIPRGPVSGWIIAVNPGGGDGDFFDIDDNGVLTFDTPPDYEAPKDDNGDNEYSFSIMAYDTNPPRGQIPGRSYFSVTVIVTDMDEPPGIDGPSEVDYRENGSGPVATYTVTDSGNPGVTWSLEGDDRDDLSISDTGELSFRSRPNYEAPVDDNTDNEYVVTVRASHETDAETLDVTVTVTNVNEAPEFPKATDTREVAENTRAGQSVGPPVAATDIDAGDSLTYTMGGDDASSFDIVSSSGQIQTKASLNHESKSRYSVTVTATDTSGASDTIAVTITVINVNEAPEFPKATDTREVAENTPARRNIGAPVEATDADNGDTLTYSLAGTDAASFDIVTSSGQIQTKSPLDYERKSSHAVTVIATDPSNVSKTITVTITVTDVEEIGTVTLSSTRPQVGTALSATLEDPDGGVSGTAWSWESSRDSSTWTNIGGATSSIYTPVTGDVGSYLRVTASYTDGHGSGKTAQAASDDTVRAAPSPPSNGGGSQVNPPPQVDNSAPAFTEGSSAGRSVAENTPAGRNIGGPVAATDADSDDTLTYSLAGADAASFDIVSTSGQIQTKAALDYETKDTYRVTVTATDTSNVSDDITVTNTDEAGTATLSPSQPQVGTQLNASVTDPDGSVSGTTWSWESSPDSSTWTNIGGATSSTYTPVTGDVRSYLRATASYTDGHGPGKTAQAVSAAVRAKPVANRAPAFAGQTATRTVAENTAAGQDIGHPVAATEQDAGDTLTYSLGGTDAASFHIVSTTGQLRTRASLDYESKSSYTVTVSVRDGKDTGGNADTTVDDTITVTITVTDVEEAGTLTLSSTQPQVGTALSATLEDPDGGVSGTTWSWESSSDRSSWATISSATSASYTPVEGDVGRYLRATASYTDRRGSGKSAQAEPANAVQAASTSTRAPEYSTRSRKHNPPTPRINRAPAFAQGASTTRSVAEHTVAGTDIGQPITATDLDDDTLTYTLGGEDAASFDIVSSSGQLRTRAALDRETRSSYTVTVTATDWANTSNTISVTIDVTDVDETPVVTGRSTVDYAENGTGPVATYAANDPEEAAVTWSLAGDDSGDFSIGSDGALTFNTPPDYELPADADKNNEYLVTIKASDGTHADTLDVTITVTDVAEAPEPPPDENGPQTAAGNQEPEFTPTEAGARSVAENTPVGEKVGLPVAASDADNDGLTYTLGGADAASFSIGLSSGQLRVNAVLDHETRDTYSVTVSVRDGKDANGNADTATDDTITVTVTVADVDEAGTVTLSAVQPQVDTRLTAALTDLDGSGFRRRLAVAERPGRLHLDRHRRRNVGQLHAGFGRRGQLPAGHRLLHRWRGVRQDRTGGVGQRDEGRTGIQRGAGVRLR